MSSAQVAAQQRDNEPQRVEDVEELLDSITRYKGQTVRVSGEVEEIIDQKAFILESGGLFNNEIVVLVPQGNLTVMEGIDVTVTGTVRVISLIEIDREYGWGLEPYMRVELEDVDTFLVADHVEL
ncbi:hypothetical protein E3U44_07405 [Nitrosococcus wardiae]|uniref:NirD/YgiW/YdeI family stress tolerance protein n=2 Tax=Nitrosococcus wardiae TaxID=1814290 RepID=A0A4P7C276_9GAMM|nr:hypothetical protein E3U44_07405 [Nitrosococcus wardiae]